MHRAGADLALLRAHPQRALGIDVLGQSRVVDEDAVAAQDVRDEVVGEDREAIEVAEAHDAGEREVGGHDLRPLVEAAVVEHRHPGGEVLREPLGRPVRLAHRLERPAPAEPPAELAQRLGVQRHELVVAGLAQRVGDLLGAHRAQLGGAPRPVGPEALGHPRGHREVAGHALPLADGGPPAGPEVDRVHADEERRDVVLAALEVVRGRVELGRSGALDGAERRLVDRDPLGPGRDLLRRPSDLLGEPHRRKSASRTPPYPRR